MSRMWQSKPLDKDVHGRCQRHQNTRLVMSTKQGIHALENSKDTDNQSELYFDQLEINTLGTAGNTDGTQALVQLKSQSPQCTNQLICKFDTGAEGNVISLITYKTMSPRCNVTQDGIHTNLHPSNMRISSSTIINNLKGIFDEHGIPERLISDNGPQYSSLGFELN